MIFDCLDPQFESTFDNEIIQPSKSKGAEIVLHCDYDKNCIELYRKIEQQKWDAVNHFLDHGYWQGFSLLPDAIDPKSQARTFTTKFDYENEQPTKIIYSRLPLMQATQLNAPMSVIKRLLTLFPASVRCANNEGELALHLALLHQASDDLVFYLISLYPRSVNEETNSGCTPIQAALKADDTSRGTMLAVFAHYTEVGADSCSGILSDAAMVPKKEFECDYYDNCTLYRKIEEGAWKAVLEFLDSGHFPSDSIFGDSIFGNWSGPDKITPRKQIQTWVTRRDAIDGKVIWIQLPVHMALIRGAPSALIHRLIDLYPESVRCADDRGMLPVHLALFHNADNAIVAKLLLNFPESVNRKSVSGLTPLDCALRAKNNVRGKILEMFATLTTATNAQKCMTQAISAQTSSSDEARQDDLV